MSKEKYPTLKKLEEVQNKIDSMDFKKINNRIRTNSTFIIPGSGTDCKRHGTKLLCITKLYNLVEVDMKSKKLESDLYSYELDDFVDFLDDLSK